MISKPFFDRFKSADKNKHNNQDQRANTPPSTEEKLLLKLLSFSLKLENNDETLLRISRTLCFSLNVDSICINQVNNKQVLLRQLFHDEENVPTENETWHADKINESVINTKHEQYYNDIKAICPENSFIEKLNAQSLLCIPSINQDEEVSVIINLFHRTAKNYTPCEIEILKQMAKRAAIYFEYEAKSKQSSTQPSASSESNLTLQLKQTTEQLNITSKSLESLSFAVSHELRAPLRSMDSFSKVLIEDFSSNLPDDAIDYVSRIRKSCIRMGHMIDDLLWLSRVSRRNLKPQNIDLTRLVKKTIKALLGDEESDRKIDLNIQANIFVYADKVLIQIAMQHLLTNAIKFTRQKDEARIELFSEKQGDKRVLAIRDNGKGFDMAYYDQLFEPFKQLHSSTKYDGTGLGLATVERVFERHNGKVWAESDIDEGATFYFTLPSE